MTPAENKLQKLSVRAVQTLFNTSIPEEAIQIQPTRKEFEGEFTIVVFPIVKLARKSPEETAEMLGKYLTDGWEEIVGFSVVKGFLNLKMNVRFWINQLSEVLTNPQYGYQRANSKPLIMVEYASPNTNKPLHLGHLRNIFLGSSVANILEAAGHNVKRVQIINDRGIHICKSMVAWKRFGKGDNPESSGIKGDHLVGKYYVRFDQEYKAQIQELRAAGKTQEEAEKNAPILVEARDMLRKWEAKDSETVQLWETMNGWVYRGFDRSYKRMGVHFDKLYYESNTWSVGKDIAIKALEDGYFYKKDDGSVWVDLTDRGLDEKLILRSDGTAVYMTQDIGTAILRYADFPALTQLVYTVGNEQEYHFKVLFLILEKLGYQWAKNCYHLSYGMVELPEGKMKSREGTVVDADDIMESMAHTAKEITDELGKLDGLEDAEKRTLYEDIGMASLKYFLLKVDPKKNMLFDPKESIDFNGHTGPFIQYSHARIQSVLRNYGAVPTSFDPLIELSALERLLQQKIYYYPSIIDTTASEYNPAILANYIYDIAKIFASFYQNLSILHAETETLKQYRVGLAAATAKIIKSGMALLGISVPDRM